MFLTPGISKFTRFNRISWGQGLLACGKENGEIELWNPSQIIQNPPSGVTPLFFAEARRMRGEYTDSSQKLRKNTVSAAPLGALLEDSLTLLGCPRIRPLLLIQIDQTHLQDDGRGIRRALRCSIFRAARSTM